MKTCSKQPDCPASSHFGDCLSMPSPPRFKDVKSCAEWLKFCLDIGWPKSALNDLEQLWWQHHTPKESKKPTTNEEDGR